MWEAEVKVLEYITGIPPTMPEAPQAAQYTLDLMSPGPSIDRARALTLKGENIEAVTVWKNLFSTTKRILLYGRFGQVSRGCR